MVTRRYDAFRKVRGMDFMACKVNVEMPKAIRSSIGTPPTRVTKNFMMIPNAKVATIRRTLVLVLMVPLTLVLGELGYRLAFASNVQSTDRRNLYH